VTWISKHRAQLRTNQTPYEVEFGKFLENFKTELRLPWRVKKQAIPTPRRGGRAINRIIDFLVKPGRGRNQIGGSLLAIELDGSQHSPKGDAVRDGEIRYPILHIPNRLSTRLSWSELAGALQFTMQGKFIRSVWLDKKEPSCARMGPPSVGKCSTPSII